MHRYEIILCWSNEDQAFILGAPELPGCLAHGDEGRYAVRDQHSRATGTTGPATQGRAPDVCLTQVDCPASDHRRSTTANPPRIQRGIKNKAAADRDREGRARTL